MEAWVSGRKYYKDYVFTNDKSTPVCWVLSEELSNILDLSRGHVLERDEDNLIELGELLVEIIDNCKLLLSFSGSGH